MAEMTSGEPQSAADYDDRTTTAVKTVLVEIGQILGSFKGKFAIVGGALPGLLPGNEDMPHVGTLDVDLGLDAEALGRLRASRCLAAGAWLEVMNAMTTTASIRKLTIQRVRG